MRRFCREASPWEIDLTVVWPKPSKRYGGEAIGSLHPTPKPGDAYVCVNGCMHMHMQRCWVAYASHLAKYIEDLLILPSSSLDPWVWSERDLTMNKLTRKVSAGRWRSADWHTKSRWLHLKNSSVSSVVNLKTEHSQCQSNKASHWQMMIHGVIWSFHAMLCRELKWWWW